MNLRTFLYSLLGLFLGLAILFLWSTFRYYTIVHADDPIVPILEGEMGIATIIRGDLAYEIGEDESYELENNDTIETAIDGRATIIWPDKSITRLGPKTRIVIEKMYAQVGYGQIQIAYTMERGKVWNTIVRSLIGDSYFEVNLPRESIVAGVRGTTFEINLENKYIRAINHSTLLSQKSQTKELYPGEMVDSENILLQKRKEWLDTTWNDWNMARDTLYESVRKLEIENRIRALTKDIGKMSLSNLSRNLLANMPGYEDIRIAEYLNTSRIDELKNITSDALLSYYQKLGNLGNESTKETLRSSLLSFDNAFIANIRESLELHAFWNTIDTGIITESTQKYLNKKGIDTDAFREKFMSGAKNDIKNFAELFTGSLNTILPF